MEKLELQDELIIVSDQQGQILLVNEAGSDLLGQTRSALEKQPLTELIALTDRDPFNSALDKAAQGQTVMLNVKTLSELELSARLSSQSGLILLEACRADELPASMRRMLDLSPIPMTLLEFVPTQDRPGRIYYINKAFSKLIGYTRQELPTSADWQEKMYPDPEYRAAVSQASLKRIEAGENQAGEPVWLTAKDGSRYLCERIYSRFGDKILVSLHNLTERYRIEEALKLSEAKTRQFLDALPIGVSIMGPDYQLQYVNQKAIELQGKGIDPETHGDLAEVYQAYIRGTNLLYPVEQMPISRALRGESVVIDDLEIQQPDKRVPIQIWGSPVFDEQGEVSLAIVAFSDISERLRFQSALHEAKEAAESANRIKSEFLANMSHEIRTPMNAIIGLNHLLEKTGLHPKQLDYVRKIQSSAQNLLRVINDVLDFSKIEAGKLELESATFDFNQVLNTLSTLLSLKANEKGLELIFDLRDQVPQYLIGDSLRLEQILLNLVNNAIKFTESGSVTVAVKIEHSSAADIQLRFSVKDTGIGLSQDQISRLFTAFNQADASITRQFGGTGLGLTIAKRLAEAMDGEIGVESEPDKGSCFWFTARFRLPSENPRKQVLPQIINGLQALIIDDQVHVQEIVSDYLRGFGMRVDTVGSGKAALQLLSTDHLPQLILLDWKMPGMDGIETLRQIRSQIPAEKQPAVILMTAYGREDLLLQLEQINVDGMLLKPLTPSTVYDAILEALQLAPAAAEPMRAEELWREQLQAYRGAQLLLVEDNLINQQVAQELLESEGFQVQIAKHGAQALERLQEHAYQLVLMDLQMPVMDGYTAARAIRARAEFKDLPIVAMTADAVAGVREQVLEAGMNDCVTKPIEMEELFRALIRWLPDPETTLLRPVGLPLSAAPLTPSNPPLNQAAQPAQSSPLSSLPGIDTEAAIRRTGGKQAFYLGLLREFQLDFANFETEYASLAPAERLRLVHTLVGVAANLGMKSLAEQARALESGLKQTHSAESTAILRQNLSAELNQLQIMLARSLPAPAVHSEPAGPLDPALLANFEARLEEFDPGARKLLDQLTGLPAGLREQLEQALARFDFEAALSLSRKLKNQLTEAPKPPLVLIVDDDPRNLQLLSELLQESGIDVAGANGGAMCFKVLARRKPDLILCDIIMPDIDGYAVCRHLKADPELRDIPLIFLTARTETEDLLKGFEAGAVDYLTKPFERAELLARVRLHMELKQARDTILDYMHRLEGLNEKLASLNEEKNQFLGIVAHDLKNPLTTIMMSADMVDARKQRLTPSELSDYMQMITRNAQRIRLIITKLLDVNKIESGRMVVESQAFDLSHFTARLSEQYQNQAERKRIELLIDLPKDPVELVSDENLLMQILDNLLSNAIKYSPPDRRVWLSLKQTRSEVLLTLRDEGPGFTPEDKAKLYQKFAKLSARPTAGEASTGLGLSIVKRLSEMLGAQLDCDSEPGRGTTFYLRLPLSPESALQTAYQVRR